MDLPFLFLILRGKYPVFQMPFIGKEVPFLSSLLCVFVLKGGLTLSNTSVVVEMSTCPPSFYSINLVIMIFVC